MLPADELCPNMHDFSDQDLLLLALAKGYIGQNDIVLASSQTGTQTPLEFLLEINLLTPEMVQELRNELNLQSYADETPTLDSSLANRSGNETDTLHFDLTKGFGAHIRFAAASNDFPKDWDRYSYVRFLGEGGMGRVFQAFDPRLKRHVAIKFIRGGDPDLEQRFIGEAQAQARVRHENLCEVYEVGKVANRPFIVMQYVDGLPLHRLGTGIGLEQKLLLIRDVAEGLHHAHRSGLIHRDIKPSNIMVENEAGALKPVVLDFGLARQQSAPGVTVTGSVIGTPHYMPPEQARGETHSLDRRGDVYSLGATAYELLAGQPPFAGESAVSVLFHVIHEDAKTLRSIDRHIPEDVETIVAKCMEKEPTRRYDSARALADDIDRFLNGEPIQARRSHLLYRIKKKAIKYKVAVGIGSTAFLILCVVIGWSLWQQVKIAAQAKQALVFGQEVQEMEDDLRKVYLAPRHDVRPHLEALKQRIQSIGARLDSVGEVGRGPGNYAIGRAYLALEQYPEALTYLDAAWLRQYQEPQVAFTYGVVLGKLYEKELDRALQITDKVERERLLAEIDAKYRTPAQTYLAMVPKDTMESPEYVQALLAYNSHKYEEALTLARSAYTNKPWFYEAMVLEGDIYRRRGGESRARGDYAAALRDFKAAEERFRYATLVGESDPSVFLSLAELAHALMLLEIYGPNNDITPYYQWGIEACDKALAANATHAESFLIAAKLHLRMAEKYRNLPESAGYLKAVLGMVEQANVAGVAGEEHCSVQGQAYKYQAELWFRRGGGDPAESYQKGYEAFTAAVALAPTYQNLNRMGALLNARGTYEMDTGRDPLKSWTLADEAFKRAREINPSLPGAAYNQGTTNYDLAYYLFDLGKDPSEAIQRTIEAFNAALKLNPSLGRVFLNLGDAHELTSLYRQSKGLALDGSVDAALTFYQNALKVMPTSSSAYERLASHWLNRSRAATRAEDAETCLTQADSYLQKGLELSPNSSRIRYLLGRRAEERAQLAYESGNDPRTWAEAALKEYEQSLAINHRQSEALLGISHVSELAALHQLRSGGTVGTWISRGLDSARTKSTVQSFYEPWSMGILLNIAAESALVHGKSAKPFLAESYETLMLAKSRAPRDEVVVSLCDWARLAISECGREGLTPSPEMITAIKETRALFTNSPEHTTAQFALAKALLALAKVDIAQAEAHRNEAHALLQQLGQRIPRMKSLVDQLLAQP